jgi:snurportin-1
MITVNVPISNTEVALQSSQAGQSFLSSEFTFQAPESSSYWNLEPEINTTTPHPHPVASVAASIEPDGLLLYVSEASFEPGTSPLSSWIPITGYDKDSERGKGEADEDERVDVNMGGEKGLSGKEGPLDLFQRFVSFD